MQDYRKAETSSVPLKQRPKPRDLAVMSWGNPFLGCCGGRALGQQLQGLKCFPLRVPTEGWMPSRANQECSPGRLQSRFAPCEGGWIV